MKRYAIFTIACVYLLIAACDLEPHSEPSLSPLNDRPNEGTWYQIMTGSFYDSDGDGVGDLKGITMKLDYLNDSHTLRHAQNIAQTGECNNSLHIDGIWLTPIHPSPSYHKYDVIDYKAVDPRFGTMDDFKELRDECHKRGIKLVIDMVLNHTSDQHPWFQKALEEVRSGKPGRYAGYYHFYYGATPPQTESVEYGEWYWEWDGHWENGVWVPDLGVKGRFYRSWGKAAEGVWYEGSFWTGMPDLNWDSHHLREELKQVAEFWLGQGLDGFRLDATQWLYKWNDWDMKQFDKGHVLHDEVEKNVQAWKWFSQVCHAINDNVYLVGECVENEETIAEYYRSGMNFFFFNACDEIKKVLNGESNGYGWAQKLRYWDWRIKARNPRAVSAPFLSNHDQDRSFYNIGGESGDWKDRPEPTMEGDDRRRFAASLNLLAPGTPYIYYGEEIGLLNNYTDYWTGSGNNNNHEYDGSYKRATDDSDRRGPMWWSNSNRNGTPNPPEQRQWSVTGMQSRYGNGVEEQFDIEYSLLNHYVRLGNLKSRHPFIAWGTMDVIKTGNDHICAYRMTDNWPGSPTYGKSVIVAHNANYYADEMFALPTWKWIDGLCSRDLSWNYEVQADGVTIKLPPYYSAIIGEYDE